MDHITVPKVENVTLLDHFAGKTLSNGILYLTATHLIYVDASGAARQETWIAVHHIATVEKLPLTSEGCPLIVRCKNFLVAHFILDSDAVCQEVYISLLKLSQTALFEDLYAFFYNPKSTKEMRENGWKLIDPISDFGRMGIPNRYWTITDANRNYEICSTYPPEIVVPKSVTLGTLVGSSKFRSKERLPVLCYLYKENNASICRCSQPLCGFYTRCEDDERLLEAIGQTNPESQFMYIIDTRPRLNALANRIAGKGYENEDYYANTRFRFMGIENIHVMRSSLQKLVEVCESKTPTVTEFLSGLDSSGWLTHIKAIMDTGTFIAKAVKVEKASVLVHCSDGWDRTAQVCSLASILLDPFYRTFSGLMTLIEKEWISMGHKFSQRCGHLHGDSKEVSPVFTQFLDCIWQLMEQFPCAFEFNEIFLLEIHDHVFSCQFGNFLGNCQKDREDMRVYEKTHCVWPFLAQRKPDFKNPLYKGLDMYGVLDPSTMPCNIQFWCGMYNRFDKGLHPQQSMIESLLESEKQKMLRVGVHELEMKLKALDEPPEELFTSCHFGDLLSQHPESPLTNPLDFMGDLHALSREGGLQAQKDQAKCQCGDCQYEQFEIIGSFKSISISENVGFSGDPGISEAMGAPEAIGISKASSEEAGCSQQQ
ncbi:phosphatidylinositol-3,5-bisphosphate 3-phosphatase MTMR8 [Glossophaga mutica]